MICVCILQRDSTLIAPMETDLNSVRRRNTPHRMKPRKKFLIKAKFCFFALHSSIRGEHALLSLIKQINTTVSYTQRGGLVK